MSRGKRTLKTRHKRAPEQPDDLLSFPSAQMARWGRFISTRGTSSTEEHSVAVDAFLKSGVEIRREQERRRDRLLEILREVDSVDLLARASLICLRIDPDAYKEWESDRSAAHIEYLVLQALGVGLSCPRNYHECRKYLGFNLPALRQLRLTRVLMTERAR